MPCFRCGARQTDPVRGASPWKRGVRADRQVLICPRCQAEHDWTAELDCRDCGHTREAVRDDERPGDLVPSGGAGPVDADLSQEVAAALSRVLKRGPVR